MIFSEGRLRQVIRQALSEGLMTEAMSKDDIKKVQTAMLDAVPKKEGESAKKHARRVIGASKPDGDFGKTSKATWASMGLKPEELGDNAEAAVKLLKQAANKKTPGGKAADAALESAKASEGAIKAIREMWNKHQKFKDDKNKNAAYLGKAWTEKSIVELDKGMFGNSDEGAILADLKEIENHSKKYNRRVSFWRLKDRILAEWLIAYDPENKEWKWDSAPPAGGGAKYIRAERFGTYWMRAIRDNAESFNGKVNSSSLPSYYDKALDGSEMKSYTSAWEAAKSLPALGKDGIDGMKAQMDLAIERGGGGPGVADGSSQTIQKRAMRRLADIFKGGFTSGGIADGVAKGAKKALAALNDDPSADDNSTSPDSAGNNPDA